MTCDIIIPVYNAYECVVECIDSVIENTNFNKNKLIIINDKSTDEKVLPKLKEYEKKYKFIEVLENKENLGFVGTVNKGMKYSKNDVLLLNSDTEVVEGWLDRIIECAYSEKMIGTVTPLSNNATHVSVPKGLQENDLPSNMSFSEYGKIVKLCAYRENQQLPTAHGFCMFIKREVLDKIGFFDEETFGKGYGEENDFSFRCLDYGYKNILCDSVIIYHKEKQSFSETREELIKTNLKKLHDRYPIYSRRIELWCENFPIRKICENIDYQIKLHNRKNILILIHDWNDPKNNVGGTTLHVWDLIRTMRDKYNFHVLAPMNGIYKLVSYFENEEKEIKFDAVDNYNMFGFYNRQYKKMIEDIIDGFRIDTIHIHHMMHHFFDIIDVAKEKKIYSMITLHDFYPLCPSINMLYKMEKYCPKISEKNCGECLIYKAGLKNNIIENWHEKWAEFLSKFNKIIVPSEDTKKEIEKIYKDIKLEVIEHGVGLEKSTYKSSIENTKEYHVAFVGVMSIHKGGKILQQLIKETKNPHIKYHLFGTSEFEELKTNKKNYLYHGRYKREDLPKLLEENKINLVCNFSIWAETYSYTLTEEIASGVPVLSFDIGAVGERIKKNKFGYTLDVNSTISEIIDKINQILENKKEYKEVLSNIEKYKIKTIDEMCKEYEDIYRKQKQLPLNKENSEILKKLIEDNYQVRETVNSAETAWILNSLKWKIVSKIKAPEFVKKIARKVVR